MYTACLQVTLTPEAQAMSLLNSYCQIIKCPIPEVDPETRQISLTMPDGMLARLEVEGVLTHRAFLTGRCSQSMCFCVCLPAPYFVMSLPACVLESLSLHIFGSLSWYAHVSLFLHAFGSLTVSVFMGMGVHVFSRQLSPFWLTNTHIERAGSAHQDWLTNRYSETHDRLTHREIRQISFVPDYACRWTLGTQQGTPRMTP